MIALPVSFARSRLFATAACTFVLLSAASLPASAHPTVGDGSPAFVASRGDTAPECGAARVGRQRLFCDYLTGAGVPAPSWIPELP